jgi:Cu+-exporting ATPase
LRKAGLRSEPTKLVIKIAKDSRTRKLGNLPPFWYLFIPQATDIPKEPYSLLQIADPMSFREQIDTIQTVRCFHCGDPLQESVIEYEGKSFCCAGCKVVYELLQKNNLQIYYALYDAPGRSATYSGEARFAYLDQPPVIARLRDFTDGNSSSLTFSLPQMHCASCVWLLERLHTIDPGISHSRVDFLKKQIRIQYTENVTSIRKIAELLASLGYEPSITLEALHKKPSSNSHRELYARVGIAGFCFGNIMLLSFPEYLASRDVDPGLQTVFQILSVLLSLPVVFYSASGYFLSAAAGLRKKVVNLDFPIALGIAILFFRSLFDISNHLGPGYLDSMSGLIFFLLLGKVFQNKTYDRLNFERNYRSYFPLGVTVLRDGSEQTVPVSDLVTGTRILVRNNEIVPADSVLLRGRGTIDYSFVTGESRAIDLEPGGMLYAGGRQQGNALELEVVRPVSQSYLTQLWNDAPTPSKREATTSRIANTTGKYFTAGLIGLSAFAALVWMPADPGRAWNAITSILIVACPCALALSTPFTFGTTLRIFGKNGLYLKSTGVIEAIARIRSIVFDKTGTITHGRDSATEFVGDPLSLREQRLVASLVRNSQHPLSRSLYAALKGPDPLLPGDFIEEPGKGICGTVDGVAIRLGSNNFAGPAAGSERIGSTLTDTRVYLTFGNTPRGYFSLHNVYRNGLERLVGTLKQHYDLHLLSGDTSGEQTFLQNLFGPGVLMRFRQSPLDKLEFVRTAQSSGGSLAMIGDGLNDAGALLQSDVGIVVAEDISAFSPACDAILEARSFQHLDLFIRFCRTSVKIVLASFGLSLLYNCGGLYFAFTGTLSPLVAAVLMPLSSITVVAFSTLTVRALARREGLL